MTVFFLGGLPVPETVLTLLSRVERWLNALVWGPATVAALLGTGLLLSLRCGFPQLKYFGRIMRGTLLAALSGRAGHGDSQNLSPFQAVSTALAGTVGTGSPFFSTDTGAVLKAAEIGADAILLAKNIDGVYTADPHTDPGAVKYSRVGYDEVLAKRLGVMDLTATSLAMDNNIPVYVFALKDPKNILRVAAGENVGTLVH